MKKKTTPLIVGLASTTLVFVGLFSAGCGAKYTEPFKDAPRSGVVNNEAADLITMPDGFSNAATKCDHKNRIYVVYHGDNPYGTIFVVPNDPTCAR
jgi:hypothetical protein